MGSMQGAGEEVEILSGRTHRAWWIAAGVATAAVIATILLLPHRRAPEPVVVEVPAFTIQDGGRTLGIGRNYRVLGNPFQADDAEAIALALRTGKVATSPALHDWNQEMLAAPKPRGSGVLAPVAEPVESDRPQFRWRPIPDAASYRVEVYDSNSNQTVSSGPIEVTEWRPEKPLPRGAAYTWLVSARVGAEEMRFPQAAEAKFDVLDATAAADLDRARAAGSRLLLAVTAARYGLWPDAAAAIDEVAQANPQIDVLQALRRSIDGHAKKSEAPL